MNENELLNFLIPEMRQSADVIVPPGDDCALVKIGNENVLMAVDQVIAGVHYTPETDVKLIAEKLLKRNLSDIAAMGGIATHAVMTLASNRHNQIWYQEFYKAMAKITKKYSVAMVGGDLAKSTNQIYEEDNVIEICTLTIFGKMTTNNILLRSNAKENEILYVTGKLGNSFKSEHHLKFSPRLKEGLFLAQNNFSSSAIDISDGLILDATRMAISSSCTIEIDDESLPLRNGASKQMALSDGEDYELLFTIPLSKTEFFEQQWHNNFPETQLTQIGKILANNQENFPNKVVINQNGVILSDEKNIGYVHRG